MYGQMRPITGKVDKRLLIPAVTIGHFATVVDTSGTAIILPSIAEEFDLDIAVVAWVTVAALLAVISLLLPMGRLADLVGRKAIYLRGLAVMSSGLVLSAISGNLPLLLTGRVITGAGAAMVMTSAIAIVIAIFPTHERGRALGLVIFAVGLGAVIGPVVSGALVDAFGWRAPFAFTATVTFTGWVLALKVLDGGRLDRSESNEADRTDWPGAIGSTTGLAILILALTNGGRLGWGSPLVVAGFLIFVLVFVSFVAWENVAPAPMIDLTIFRIRQFSWSITARFLGFLSNGPTNFLMPFYLQDVTGRSASQTGLLVAPLAAVMAIVGARAGSLSDRIGFRTFILLGLGLQLGTLTSFSMFDRSTPVEVIVATMVMHGLGSGLWMVANMSAAVGAVPQSVHSIAGALLNLVRSVANVTSVAISSAIVASLLIAADSVDVNVDDSDAAVDAFVSGMHTVFRLLISAVVLAIAATVMASRTTETTAT
jgi:EmrB/QacA subfamily drug resistance transporter